MRQFLLLAVVLVAAIVAGLTWAFKNLPWWGSVALVVALVVVAKFVAGRLFIWALSIPFKWKGAVLRGATIQVHSLVPADPPAPSKSAEAKDGGPAEDADETASAEEEPASPRQWWQLDATITPTQSSGKFTHWSPSELVLVKPESRIRLHGEDDKDDCCEIKRVEVEQDGQFKEDEGWRYAGPQRLKLLLAVQPDVPRLKCRYYFEEFGEVQLPGPTNAQQAPASSGQRAA